MTHRQTHDQQTHQHLVDKVMIAALLNSSMIFSPSPPTVRGTRLQSPLKLGDLGGKYKNSVGSFRLQFRDAMIATGILCIPLIGLGESALALPPAEDKPEEVLRSRIITGARSPIDGKPMTAAEYAELQIQLRTPPPGKAQVSPKVRKVINLLKLRKFIKTFFPFIPIR